MFQLRERSPPSPVDNKHTMKNSLRTTQRYEKPKLMSIKINEIKPLMILVITGSTSPENPGTSQNLISSEVKKRHGKGGEYNEELRRGLDPRQVDKRGCFPKEKAA
ncbi:MAG: hypothetical protein ACE144_01300 [Thermodesulfobacteriota bacterium]